MSFANNSLFSTLGAKPAIGRLPLPDEEPNVVVISDIAPVIAPTTAPRMAPAMK